MAEISIDRDAVEKIEAGKAKIFGENDKFASFLTNKFREEEAKARHDEPSWVYTIWTYRF